jgi:sulfonate transport system substrate-binding protein
VGAELGGPRRRLTVQVRPDSACTSLVDLKGGRLALQRGSDAHYLLARALREVGIEWREVEPVWLAPPEARMALERGTVDAACSCAIEGSPDSDRSATLHVASPLGLSAQGHVYLASPSFAARHPQALLTLLSELKEAEDRWHSNPLQAARLLGDARGPLRFPLQTLLAFRPHAMAPLTAAWVADQQRLADDLARLRLVYEPAPVRDHVWRPRP